ncbi:MAG: hypothetical protein IKC95_02850 [Oscillospiraceae bacterium]|nr:hypothetical protein [Oscillospiraceae bacterium]
MKKSKKLWIIGLLAILLVAVAVISVFALTRKTRTVKKLPNYGALTSLIGMSWEEAYSQMGWQKNTWTDDEQNTGYWETPLKVEYEGVPMTVYLGLDIATKKVSTVQYRVAYTNQPETAGEEVYKLVNKLVKALGEKAFLSEASNPDMMQEELTEWFEKEKSGSMTLYWDCRELATDSQKAYLQEVKNAPHWQHLINPSSMPQYGLEVRVSKTESGAVGLVMAIGVQRSYPIG